MLETIFSAVLYYVMNLFSINCLHDFQCLIYDLNFYEHISGFGYALVSSSYTIVLNLKCKFNNKLLSI